MAAPDPLPQAPVRPDSGAGRWADVGLVALTVTFGFLAASFVAHNSDVWLRLAAGRLLAEGGYAFGVDPFSYTTAGVYWADHAWLTELGLYAAYTRLGGPAVAVLKAVGVAVLAGLMLRSGRSGGPVWVAAGCTLLALLAASPRFLVQPACVSLLLLAVCLSLLQAGGRRTWVALPIVVAAWANLDGWYVLGPVVVALFWLGGRLSRGEPDRPAQPWWLLPACLLACLATPFHVRGLTLPPELSPAVWASGLSHDPQLSGVFASPWRAAPLGPAGGYSLAAWAYPVLLALGLASFAVNRRAAASWRGLVWVAFAALSAWQARLVPFFAVVAGPVTALNLGEAVRAGFLARTGRVVTVAVALGLLLVAWPGWLQGFHARDRAVGWDVQPEPSLRRAAEEVARWRAEGKLPADENVFGSHPDFAHHAAWFAPGVRTFLDSRLELFPEVAAEYRRLSAAVGVAPDEGDAAAGRDDLRNRRIAVVVLHDPDRRRFASELRHAVASPDRWAVLAVPGDALVVAASAGSTLSVGVAPFDPERAAFGTAGTETDPPPPEAGPPQLPEPPVWWEFFARRPRVESWEAGAADTYLRLFAETGGKAGKEPGARSPALPLLAIRTARAATARNPADADAWVALGRAYLFLGRTTWEADGAALPLLAPLRHTQVAAALHQAVVADPDSAPAHDLLAGLFVERGYLDLALRHRAAQLRLARRAGPSAGEPTDQYADRVERLAAAVEQLEVRVMDAENRFLVHTHRAAGDPLARAHTAVQLGLVARAQDVLIQSHPDLYGPAGVTLLLRLLVLTGQVEQARVLLDREELARNPATLGVFDLPGGVKDGRPWGYRLLAYDWYDLCQAAGAGRYDRAARALGRLRAALDQNAAVVAPGLGRELAVRVTQEVGVAAAPVVVRLYAARERDRVAGNYQEVRFLAVQTADLGAVAGLLWAEQGRVAEAATEFDRAEAGYAAAGPWAPVLPGRPVVLRYRSAILRARK
jgi:tetratricopeptide (TPR) repeat protein